jgi:hypothetical protein
MDVSRRDLCSALIGAAGLLGLGSSGFARAATAGALRDATLTPLQRFMKVYASLEAGTLWYWYSGIVEMAVQDGPIVPLIGIDTLIRRDVSLNADGTFTVMSTEANYFRGLDDARPVDEIANPVTGRTVQPLHFSEARRRNVWSEPALLPRKTGSSKPRWPGARPVPIRGSTARCTPMHRIRWTSGNGRWKHRGCATAPDRFRPIAP